MKIHLPPNVWLSSFGHFLSRIDLSEPRSLEVSWDKRWVNVHPVVLAMVGSLALKTGKEHILASRFEARSINYFQRMGLFDYLGYEAGIAINEHKPAGRFIPLTQVNTQSELDGFLQDMIPLLHLDPGHVRAIRYAADELIRNVLEHSYCGYGATVAAQYYPNSKLVRIGIADTGIGIRQSMAASHRVETDLEAMRLALMPGITGVTSREGGDERNAGAGLFFTKSMADAGHTPFLLYSGSASFLLNKRRPGQPLRLHADPFDDRHRAVQGLPHWTGTVVGIDLSLEVTEDFSDLLDLVNDTYETAVRDRRMRRNRRKPKFI